MSGAFIVKDENRRSLVRCYSGSNKEFVLMDQTTKPQCYYCITFICIVTEERNEGGIKKGMGGETRRGERKRGMEELREELKGRRRGKGITFVSLLFYITNFRTLKLPLSLVLYGVCCVNCLTHILKLIFNKLLTLYSIQGEAF